MDEILVKIFRSFPYLFANLVGTPFVLVAFFLAKGQRRMMGLSGLVAAAFSPVAVLHEGEYWTPVRIGGLFFGLEDILFSFLTGSMAWFMAVWPYRQRLIIQIHPPAFLKRFAATALVGIAFLFIFRLSGLEVMSATLSGQVLLAGLVLKFQRNLWPMAVAGMLGYLAFHGLEMKIWFWLWPEFLSYWNAASFWSQRFCGLPVGEIFFTASFGAAVPIFLGYYANARLTKPERAHGA